MKTKKEFEQFFKTEIEPQLSANDLPMKRQVWNDTIDAMIKGGELPARAGNWSHPSDRPLTVRKQKPGAKIKTIDITALEWTDKVNGNSYFAGTITINHGMKDAKTLNMGFQYGHGEHYKDIAFMELLKAGIITDADQESLWRYCDRKKIILRTTKHEGCKKSELKAIAN